MGNSSQKIIAYNDANNLKKMNNRSKGEKMTRLILESLFNASFITERPDFLNYTNSKTPNKRVMKVTNTNKKTKKKNNLEIDLYNNVLKLGIEYQGNQHFVYTPYFHKNHEGFVRSTNKDHFKRKKCYKEGICLVEIFDFVKEEDLGKHILDALPSRLVEKIDPKRKKLLLEGKVVLLNP